MSSMDTEFPSRQRIARLRSLSEVTALLDRVSTVSPRTIAAADATGCALAQDIALDRPLPSSPRARIDGWAVSSELLRDAGSYAPIPLAGIPPRVDAGDPIPTDCDAVAPPDAIRVGDGFAEAVAPVTAGDGVTPAAADAGPSQALRRAGERLRTSDAAVLAAAAIFRVPVRQPRIRLLRAGASAAGALELIASMLSAASADTDLAGITLEAALDEPGADAIIGVGGVGSGRKDRAVEVLARRGTLEVHGVGLMPGETAAFGHAGGKPVLLLPGAVDAALGAWLALGRLLLRRLSGETGDAMTIPAALSRKVTSTIGIADIVLLQRDGDSVSPLASGFFPLSAIAQADGWIAVPADREGFAAGTIVQMAPLP
jgi:molybdopterin biosynthesis enzyme